MTSASNHYDVIVLGGRLRVAIVELELGGGECSYWACIPSKSLLRPGEAVHGALEAAATAPVDVRAALAWRDFMVSGYSDASAARCLADRGIALLRGTGRLAGTGVVEVDGVRYTAEHVVLATGADPILPAVPGLRELDGVWSTREATGMTAVPERLIVLGGGPAGLELAQVVRHLGGEVVLVEGEAQVLAREPAPSGRRSPRRCAATASSSSSACTRQRPSARATSSCSSSPMVARPAAIGCASPPAGAPASTGSGSRSSASPPTPAGSRSVRGCRRASGCGRSAT
jgi:hypothetical protein